MENILHENGTVTYWSTYRQRWIRNATWVPNCEFAAMSHDERWEIIRHLEGNNGKR